jgi:hypothetical protein
VLHARHAPKQSVYPAIYMDTLQGDFIAALARELGFLTHNGPSQWARPLTGAWMMVLVKFLPMARAQQLGNV